jgi:predicted membrane channel-forming protein YqfA (hemolysin III family)
MLGWACRRYHKKHAQHVTPKLMFFASRVICGSRSAFWCIRAAKRRRTIFMFGWDRCRYQKKRVRKCYTEIVFLHLMRSTSDIVRSGASRARNVDTLFFMLEWARCGFHKRRAQTHNAKIVCFASGGICGSRIAFWCVRATKCQHAIFHALVLLVQIPQKAHRETLD